MESSVVAAPLVPGLTTIVRPEMFSVAARVAIAVDNAHYRMAAENGLADL